MKESIKSLLFLLLLGGSIFWCAAWFGIKMRARINDKRELDSLKMVNLQLSNELLKAQILEKTSQHLQSESEP